MKAALKFGRGDAVLLWLACAGVLCAGFYVAFGIFGAAIDGIHDRTGQLAALMAADAQILAQSPALDRREHAIEARLDALQLRADKPATVARFIRTAGRMAAARRVNLVEIDERAAAIVTPPPASRTAGAAPEASALEAIPLDVTLRGTYRALLGTICDLAQYPLAMSIEIASVERDAPATSDPAGGPLTARLRVDLQRLGDSPSALPLRPSGL